MGMKGPLAKDIDEYISRHPRPVQALLRQLRQTIRKAAPEAGEKISYAIPTFTLHGNLVHFAAFDTHIGFYPSASGIGRFKQQLARYPLSKGTVQFPIEGPIPLSLVSRMVKYRVEENSRQKKKRNKKK